MKLKMKVFIVLLLLVYIQAQGQNMRLPLQKAVQMALDKNLEVRNAAIEKQKSQYQYKADQSQLFPQLEAFSNFTYYYALPKLVVPGEIFGQSGNIPVEFGTKYDWSFGFKATQVLYNQSYYTSLEISSQKLHLDELTLKQKQEEIAYQISQVYFLCQTSQEQMKHLAIMLDNMDRLLAVTQLQQENGMVLKVEYDQVAVRKNNLLTEVDHLEQLYFQQINLLKYLTGIDLDVNVALTDSLTQLSTFEKAPDIAAWTHQTDIQTIDQQIEMSRLTNSMNKQRYLPVLSAVAQYNYQGQRDEFDFFKGGNDKFFKVGYVGLNLSIPLFDGFEKKVLIKQNELTLEQLRNSRENMIKYYHKEYLDAHKQYETNKETLIRQQQNIQAAENSYKVTLQKYQQQMVSLSDLLMAQNSLTEAYLSYDNALLQLRNAELNLIKLKGEILHMAEMNE